MLAMEELLCELIGEDRNEQGLPPGFRFHPTDEELITFYLASKVFNGSFCGVEIAEVDLNRCEPWDLPDVARMGEREWYFFSLRDRKYPTGLRTNRATGAGYWKATGKDREVFSASSGGLLGMKKTLVFYKGRAPRGEKTKWVMHEYRLDGDFSYRHPSKEEWVICRIFHKNGEKKSSGLLQGQGFFMESSLPSLLEVTPSTLQESPLQNPFNIIYHQQNDLKTLLLNYNGFQPFFSPNSNAIGINTEAAKQNSDNNPSQSMLFKSLICHQVCNLKDPSSVPSVPIRQCKTETNFSSSQFQLPNDDHDDSGGDANLINWADKIHPNTSYNYNPSLSFDMDCGISAAAVTTTANDSGIATVHEMSTSNVAFNRVGFQMMLDTPISIPPESSWPLHP